MAGGSRRRGYMHKALNDPTSETRLLKFLRSEEPGDICCTLHNVSLTSNPVYIAGSYEWGDPDLDVDIRIDGQLVAIRHNLWLFLHWLTLNKQGILYAREFYLWVDALCIDQSNAAEKGRQVQMMGRIFRQATFVYAWLGWTGALDASSNVHFVTEASCQFSASIDPDAQIDQWSEVFIPYEGLGRLFEGNPLEKHWGNVLHFLKLRFWSRRWIVQEILLARDVMLVYDGKELPWLTLQLLFDNLAQWTASNSRIYSLISPVYAEIYSEIQGTVAWSMRQHRKFTVRTGLEHLSSLLTDFASTECEVAYDKVYSFLHLLPEGDSVPVNYECTPIQVFSNIVRATTDSLDLHGKAIVTLANELNISATFAGENVTTSSNQAGISHCIPINLNNVRLTKIIYATSTWPDFDKTTPPGPLGREYETSLSAKDRDEKFRTILKQPRLDIQQNRAILKDSRVNATVLTRASQSAADNSGPRGRPERNPSYEGVLQEEQDLFVLCADGTIAAIPAGVLFQLSAETPTQACSFFLCRPPLTSGCQWYLVLENAIANCDLEVSSISPEKYFTITGLARRIGRLTVLGDGRREDPPPVIVIEHVTRLYQLPQRIALPCPEDFLEAVRVLHDKHAIAFSRLPHQHGSYFYLTRSTLEVLKESTIPAVELEDDETIVHLYRPAPKIQVQDRFAQWIARAVDWRRSRSPERNGASGRNRTHFQPRDATTFHLFMPAASATKSSILPKVVFLFEAHDLIEIARVLSYEP